MHSLLGHNEHPLSDKEWKKLNESVLEVARRTLVCRRFIDLYGPLGAGVQAVAQDEFEGVAPGAVDTVGAEEAGAVFADKRSFKPIPMIYKDFLLHWRDIQAAQAHNMPLDISAAAGAAAFCAQREDQLIFYGDEKLGIEGLLTATGRSTIELSDWTEPGAGFANVVQATELLLGNGHYGPYAVVVSPRLYAKLHRVYEGTGVLEIETVRKIASEGVYQSNLLKADTAVVVSTGRENLDIAVAMDMSVAYLGAEQMNHPFRVLESLILRIKHPDAICTIEAAQS